MEPSPHYPSYGQGLMQFQQPTPPAHQSSVFSPLPSYNIPPTPAAPGSNMGHIGNMFSAPPAHTGSVASMNLPSTSMGGMAASASSVNPMTPLNPATPATESSGIVPQLQNIVCTVNLGCKLDLKKIALHARNAEYNPKRFAAVIMRIRDPRTTALIFSSGKMVCTGAKSEDMAKLAARKYARIVQKLGFSAKFLDFKIQNMVGSCDVKFPIRLEGLVLTHAQFSSYEPELFPGLIYRMVKPRIVLLIFVSGKVVLTGAKNMTEMIEAFENYYPSLVKKLIPEGNQPQPIEAKLRDIKTIIVNDQSMLHLFYFGLEAIGAKERTEINEAFENIYPILKGFKKQ